MKKEKREERDTVEKRGMERGKVGLGRGRRGESRVRGRGHKAASNQTDRFR